ncbi:MAG: UPF0149 family protein [Pseudomonadota bacterium]
MNPQPAPDYDELDRLLHDAGAELSAAEVHGRVAGFVCATGGRGASGAALLFRDEPGGSDGQLEQAIARLARDCQARLDDAQFSFEPLLPGADDDVDAGALGDWCRGFLDGLIGGGLRNIRGLSGEVGEFMKDLMLLGEAEANPEATDEEEARALAELIEYLRAGAQLIYDEYRQAPDN